MNMIKIRVLSDNLEELLGQFNRGEHVEPEDRDELLNDPDFKTRLKAEWWIAIRGVAASLAREFNLASKEFASPRVSEITLVHFPKKNNCFIREVSALLKFARKLLADMSTAKEESSATTAV